MIMNSKITFLREYIEHRKSLETVYDLEINEELFLQCLSDFQLHENFLKNNLSNDLLTYINEFYDEDNKKRFYVYMNEFKFFFNWFMQKFCEQNQKIDTNYSEFYCYIYLNIDDEQKKQFYLNYIDSFECDKTIDYCEFFYAFFVSIFYDMKFIYQTSKIDKNTLNYLNYFYQKFNYLYDLMKTGKMKIQMIPNYEQEYNKMKNIEDEHQQNLNNNNDNEDEVQSLEDDLMKKIYNNMNITFYDIICYYSDHGLSSYIHLFGYWILLKYFNEKEDLNNSDFPKKPNYELKDNMDDYLSTLLLLDNGSSYREEEENDIPDSFMSYYIGFKHFYSFETEHVLEGESLMLIQNLLQTEIQIFEKRLVENNIVIMPLSTVFNLENYTYFLRDIFYTQSNELKILYFKNLQSYEFTDILKTNYFNLFIRCVNYGKYFTIKKNPDNTKEYYYHDQPNREIIPVELNDWIQKVKDEIFTLDPFVKNYSYQIMNNFLTNIYPLIKTNSSTIQECSICITDTEPNENNMYCTTCRHLFHFNCINEWFKKNLNNLIKPCPLCRTNMYCSFLPSYELYPSIYTELLKI